MLFYYTTLKVLDEWPVATRPATNFNFICDWEPWICLCSPNSLMVNSPRIQLCKPCVSKNMLECRQNICSGYLLGAMMQWTSLPSFPQNHCSVLSDPCTLIILDNPPARLPDGGASSPGKCSSWPKPWKSRKQDSKSCRSLPSLPLCSVLM